MSTEKTSEFLTGLMGAYAASMDGRGAVAIAHDYSTSSGLIARTCADALQRNGIDVVDLEVVPPACLQFTTHAVEARGGLMVTACPGSTEIHGIAFAGREGWPMSPEAERQIERAFSLREDRVGGREQRGRTRTETGAIDPYLESIAGHVDRPAIRTAAPRVVLDCGNSASGATSPRLLGAHLGSRLTTLHASPPGAVPVAASVPFEENLHHLRTTVVRVGAALGIAHYGDSERILCVDETGRFVPGASVQIGRAHV